MDDQGCPRCKTTKYRNPSLKLMVNVCGHTLCENCVDMLFVRGSGNCVQCDTPLRKSNFRVQLFEDPAVDKEVEIRKKVLRIYNKREPDFSTLKEYNDYLEQVEDIVYNLTNNVDVESTKQLMEQYQRENRDIIQKNKAKLTREQEELEELLLQEQQGNEQRRLKTLQEEQRQLQAKRKSKQALLDDLLDDVFNYPTFNAVKAIKERLFGVIIKFQWKLWVICLTVERSQLPATLLLAQHKDRAAQLESEIEKQKQTVKPATIFSTGILMGQTVSLQPVARIEETLYQYHPIHIETYGPLVPQLDQLDRLGYLKHVRAAMPQDTAGGYTSALACHRAIQDAFSGMFSSLG